jgi:hypothetical protein
MMEKYVFSKLRIEFILWKKLKIIHFVNMETDPRATVVMSL